MQSRNLYNYFINTSPYYVHVNNGTERLFYNDLDYKRLAKTNYQYETITETSTIHMNAGCKKIP